MKKSVAIGAAVATALGTTLASATGAQAVAQTDCATLTDYQTSMIPTFTSQYDNWITSCLPQFGIGKAEFTVSSDVDFPSDFKPLSDAAVTVSTNWATSQLNSYMGNEVTDRTRLSIARLDNGSNNRSQSYRIGDGGNLTPFPIHSITRVSTATVTAAAGCNNPSFPYTDAFIIDYDPLDITFTQEAGGEIWSTMVTINPDDVQVGFVIDDSGVKTGTDASLCVLRGNMVYASHNSEDFFPTATDVLSNLNPYPTGVGTNSVGDFAFVHEVAPPVEDTALPNTGLDIANRWAWLTAGLAMMAAGGVAAGVRRRRKHTK